MVVLLASRAGGGSAEGRVIAVSPRMDLALAARAAGFPAGGGGARTRRSGPGLAVTAAGIDAGDGGAGERLALSGVVLDPREDIAAFGPGLVAWLPGARPGFSGGPLLDERGRLVGMVTAIRPAGAAGPWRSPAAGPRAGGRRSRPSCCGRPFVAGRGLAAAFLTARRPLEGPSRPERSGVRWRAPLSGRGARCRMSVDGFTFPGLPARVIFGDGTLAEVGPEIARLGRRRALVLATPGHARGGGAAGGGCSGRWPPGSSPGPRCTRRSR